MASETVGEPVVHDFSAYDTHVYPVGLYPALRSHVSTRIGGSFAEVMSAGVCKDGKAAAAATSSIEKRYFRRAMLYGLMATFMW